MAENRETDLAPVEGEIILDSPLKKLALCLGLIVLAPLGAWVVWAWWTEFLILKWQVTWYGALFGALLVLGGILAVPVSIFCFFRRPRLILGKECLQQIHHERVAWQIPYRNIARIGMGEAEVTGKFLGIDVRDLNDPGTLCPAAELTKNTFGWHYTLSDEFWTVPLTQIHDQINKRLQAG